METRGNHASTSQTHTTYASTSSLLSSPCPLLSSPLPSSPLLPAPLSILSFPLRYHISAHGVMFNLLRMRHCCARAKDPLTGCRPCSMASTHPIARRRCWPREKDKGSRRNASTPTPYVHSLSLVDKRSHVCSHSESPGPARLATLSRAKPPGPAMVS